MENVTPRPIIVGSAVTGDLGRPGTGLTGRVIMLYPVALQGVEVAAAKVQMPDGSIRYALVEDLVHADGSHVAATPDDVMATTDLIGDIQRERADRAMRIRPMSFGTRRVAAKDIQAGNVVVSCGYRYVVIEVTHTYLGTTVVKLDDGTCHVFGPDDSAFLLDVTDGATRRS